MRLEFAVRACCGARDHQEDAVAVRPEVGETVCDRACDGETAELLVALADGLGGHVHGEVASRIGCAAFMAAMEGPAGRDGDLALGLHGADAAIAAAVTDETALEGMATTLLGLRMADDGLSWASAGDTHLFLFREGMLLLLNADHSGYPMSLKRWAAGELTRALAELAADNNVLASSLGGRGIRLVDVSRRPLPLAVGDLLIAATDGIDTLRHEELSKLCCELAGTAGEIAESLLAAVAAAGDPAQDNVTLCVVKVADVEALTAPAPDAVGVAAPAIDAPGAETANGWRLRSAGSVHESAMPRQARQAPPSLSTVPEPIADRVEAGHADVGG